MHYHGWQNQPNAVTVQKVLEESLSTLLRKPIGVVGAGRTDARVHAQEMYAHFDFVGLNALEDLIYRLNAFLPEDIAVQDIFQVSDDAHARFDAIERTYEYWVVQEKNPFYKDRAHYVRHPLNIEAMNDASEILLKYKDFECFSKTNTDVKTFICDVRDAIWERKNNHLLFRISADRFLRNMVRAIVGTLLDIGLGKMSIENMAMVIESKDRGMAGASVPAKGLYLTRVLYPENISDGQGK